MGYAGGLANAAVAMLALSFFLSLLWLLGFVPPTLACDLLGRCDEMIISPDYYWKELAMPFRITSHSVAPGGGMQLGLKNAGTSAIYLSSISISEPGSGKAYSASFNQSFAAGEEKQLFARAAPGRPGGAYSFGVEITYVHENGALGREYGSKNLNGQYT